MNKELPKNYDPKKSEKKWQDFWEKEGIYKFDENSKKPVFSVDTPPPYISSDSLHTGHAMSYAQAEIIIRYHRMKGENVFYPMGFDDNGLPTERFVEKKYKVDKSKITQKEFVELCLKETKEGGKKYEEIWKSLGLSVDWSLLYSTISPLSQKISQRSFIDLYKKGRVYREESPTFWCTQCQTSLAQADLEDKEEKSLMYDIEFKFENGDPAIISTTRPELIPACVALYVNPDDSRYKKYARGYAISPLMEAKIPVKTSKDVEMDKGTGLMMVCTWGDTEDIEKWKADKLETKLIIDKSGRVNEKGGKYQGMKLSNAREEIIKDLEESGLLKNKMEIIHTLNIHERCKHPIDFFVSPQWFIKILDIKDAFKKRGEELNWYPKFMKVQLDNWIDGLKWDWCVSRDRFYGVPFPIWYCENCGEIILPKDNELPVDPRENLPKNPVCSKCQSKKIKGETQVMDTWATSSTTPLINNHWKEKDEKNIYPMSLRVQGFEIIRTWLFYTLVKSHLNTNSIPWKNVMISGWGLARNGEKMSKSLNNFITAESMIERYSADALRFWSCGATLGMNLRFSEDDMRAGQKLLTKLWNATRFVMMNLEDYNRKTFINAEDLCEADAWILAELQELIKNVTEQFENYEFAKAKTLLEHFFWIKFADNYIELIKGRLYGEDKKIKLSAQFTLYSAISTLIKLFAPMLPHVSEEIYQQFFISSDNSISIHISAWPKENKEFESKNYLENGKIILETIAEIRRIKAEKGIKLGESFKKLAIGTESEFVKKISSDLKNLSHAEEIGLIDSKKLAIEIEK
ncbi:MAG: valine--tRNA ligase [Patescibacteria group bacterium]